MAILSGLSNLVKKNFSQDTILEVQRRTNVLLGALTSPIQSITNPEKARIETSKKSAVKLVSEGVENTLLVLAPFTSGGKSLLTKAAIKSVSTVKGAITAIVGGGVVVGGLSTKTGRELATNLPTPTDIFTSSKQSSEKVFEFIGGENTNIPTEADWYKIARGLGLGAGISILAAGGIYAGYKLFGDKLEKVKEELPKSPTPTEIKSELPIMPSIPSTIPTNTETPTLPATQTITTGTGLSTTKKKRRQKTASKPQNISQRVNILITDKYLNGGVSSFNNGIRRRT